MVKDREAWRAAVHGVTKSWVTEQQLKGEQDIYEYDSTYFRKGVRGKQVLEFGSVAVQITFCFIPWGFSRQEY